MNNNSRIKLEDTPIDSMVKLAEGNPGALTVMLSLVKSNEEIDPQGFMGPLGSILSLDSHGIYGSRIWMFFKDVCGEDLTKMVACLRAIQLGIIPEDKINHAIDNYGDGIDVDELHEKVCEELEEFKKPEKA
jgi:hypothetical protein